MLLAMLELMKASAIRHLAVSNLGLRFAAAEFEKTVSIWDLETCQKQFEFQTVLDFGGSRLGIDNDARRCIAGAYNVHGIACYETITGSLIWQRKDLKKVQRISLTPNGSIAVCGFEEKPLHMLDMRDGKSLEKFRGCRRLVFSPYESFRFADKARPEIQNLEGRTIAKLGRETFAVLSVAFGLGYFTISESGGGVRCFEASTGKLIWRYKPQVGSHVLTLGYNPLAKTFMGVLWPYQKGGSKSLLVFDSSNGDVVNNFPLGSSSEEVFCLNGQRLLSSAGWLLDCSTEKVCGSFSFPLKEYCD